ncbi:pentapeptide repeat-containing protein [Membranihabitans maritimus]|uniref:pentapeptide repeat-containing protein n=1 Tax=Membranihabitans maritimus TaxID=2904244 RepID=UPI001F3AAE18|nr:pentapeptide repeat-containing protein [Membranihabitans maritimus]
MTIYLLCLIGLVTITLITLILIQFLNLLTEKKQIKQKSYFKKIKIMWQRIQLDKVKLSFFTLFIVILITIIIFQLSPKTSIDNLFENLKPSMIASIVDAAILVLLFNWVNSKGENKLEIKRYIEEIDDLRYSNSKESIFRIIGIIKRLNKLGSKNRGNIDLSHVNFGRIGNIELFPDYLSGMNLSRAKLFQTNFSNLNMPNIVLNKSSGGGIDFTNSEILNGQFINCDFQRINFTEAYLFGANFSNTTFRGECSFEKAILEKVDFFNVRFPPDTNFEGARVNKDFFNQVQDWQLRGDFQFQNYISKQIQIGSGSSCFLFKEQ